MSNKTNALIAFLAVCLMSLTSSTANAAYEDHQTIKFDTSLPVDFERCSKTQAISDYLNSLGKDDIKNLTHLQQFLIGCQKMATDSINAKKQKLAALEAKKNN